MRRYRIKCFLSILTGLFLVGLYFVAARVNHFNDAGNLAGLNYNLVIYIISLLLAFFLYYAAYFSSDRMTFGHNAVSKKIERFFYAFASLLFIVYLYGIYEWETKLPPYSLQRHFIREGLNRTSYRLLFTAVMIFIAVHLHKHLLHKKTAGYKYFRTITSLVIAFLSAILTFAPNVFLNPTWDLYHTHAYMNSIINVAHQIPYDNINCSIYGHYGLIYLPFVKLLGDNMMAISLTISIFTFIAIGCACYVASRLIRHDGIFLLTIMGILGTLTTYFGPGEYFQSMPHRYVFPLISLAYVVLPREKSTAGTPILMDLLIGALAITFNLESGMAVVVVLATFRFCMRQKSLRSIFSRVGVLVFYVILYISISFIGAYLLVNLYNVLAGGEWNTVLTFLYPIGSSYFESYGKPLPRVYAAGYLLQISVFAVTAFKALCSLWECGRDSSKKDHLMAQLAVAVSGLAAFPYLISSVGSMLSITHIQFVILVGVYAEYSSVRLRKKIGWFKRSAISYAYVVSLAMFLLTSWFAVEGGVQLVSSVFIRVNTVWDRTSLSAAVTYFKSVVPEKTPGAGRGIPELYYMLGWDTGIYLSDWSNPNDVTQHSIEILRDEMKKWDRFVAAENAGIQAPGFEVKERIVLDALQQKKDDWQAFEAQMKGATQVIPTNEVTMDKMIFLLYQRKNLVD